MAAMSEMGQSWSFTYDANSMRTERRNANGGYMYTYTYNGEQLSRMTCGNNVMWFTYGADGSPLTINYNGTTYYYVTNLQGDVVAILNSSGTAVVNYTYDAWGKPFNPTGSMASTLGYYNPLRYRGYVYDEETGLYYLQSRYYNPTIGRFINADNQLATGDFTGLNLFAYCDNNPVVRVDPNGQFWDYVADIGFLLWSVADVVNDPGDWKNWAALAVDAVFAVVPFVPSGVGQVIKVGNKIDNALDVANAINKIDNIQDATKVTMIGRNMERVTSTANLIGKADNLYDTWKGYDAAATGIKRFLHNGISMAHNGKWLFGKLRQGYTVIDIGLSTMHKGRGLWYGTERFVLGLWETRNIWKLPINIYF